MGSLARADLETLLHTKKLDRTLTQIDRGRPQLEYASTGHAALDARLSGGVPRGQVSELVGPRSSGRTMLMLQAIAAATRRGELVALVDALDMFDVESAAACGVDLDRLLWIRGLVVMNPGMCRDLNQRALVQAVRALTLVLDAGNFGLVVFDVGEAPSDAVRRLPFTTWLRLQRMVEGTSTVCLLVGSDRLSRSPRGLSLQASALRAAV
jgi:RecA DNA recombination protein